MKRRICIALLCAGLMGLMLCAAALAEETYAITTDGAARAYYYNDSFEQVFPDSAAAGTELSLMLDERAVPGNGYYFTGEFTVNGASLGREFSEDGLYSWPVAAFTITEGAPDGVVTVGAVQAAREALTLTLAPGETVALPFDAWMQLQYMEPVGVEYPLIPYDDAGEYLDVNLDGRPDLQIAFDDDGTCVNLTPLPGCAAFGEFTYSFTGSTDHYSAITFAIPVPDFGPSDFRLPDAAIGEGAFEGDAAITAVDASGCASIGKDAFRDCANLTRIKLPQDCPIDADAFAGCGTVLVFAPEGGTTQAFCEGSGNCAFVTSAALRMHAVRFLNDDGTVLYTCHMKPGDTPSYPGGTPEKDPDNYYTYAFAGWSPDLSEVTGDADYTASYTRENRRYTIEFHYLESNEEAGMITRLLLYGHTPLPPDVPPQLGSDGKYHPFDHWTPKIEPVSKDATYTAVYSEEGYYRIVFYDDDGVKVLGEGYYPKNTPASEIEIPTVPEKEGSTFTGWVPAVADVTDNAKYTAAYRGSGSQGGNGGEEPIVGPGSHDTNIQEVTVLSDGVPQELKDWVDDFNYDALSVEEQRRLMAVCDYMAKPTVIDRGVWRNTVSNSATTVAVYIPCTDYVYAFLNSVIVYYFNPNPDVANWTTQVLQGTRIDENTVVIVLSGDFLSTVGTYPFGMIVVGEKSNF